MVSMHQFHMDDVTVCTKNRNAIGILFRFFFFCLSEIDFCGF